MLPIMVCQPCVRGCERGEGGGQKRDTHAQLWNRVFLEEVNSWEEHLCTCVCVDGSTSVVS